MQLPSEQERLEQTNGDLLAQISYVDPQIARRVLRKFNGDMEKAADALLAGDRALEWETKHRTTPEPMYSDGMDPSTTAGNLPIPSTSVIDLTTDDDAEMTRAIQMSIDESSQATPKFGPSERAPNPEWAMVRSNVRYKSLRLRLSVSYPFYYRNRLSLARRMKIIPSMKPFKPAFKTSKKKKWIYLPSQILFEREDGTHLCTHVLRSRFWLIGLLIQPHRSPHRYKRTGLWCFGECSRHLIRKLLKTDP